MIHLLRYLSSYLISLLMQLNDVLLLGLVVGQVRHCHISPVDIVEYFYGKFTIRVIVFFSVANLFPFPLL